MKTDEQALVLADRRVGNPADKIRRYCRLEWSHGPPEIWAYPYYDAPPTREDDEVRYEDVLAAAALHPGLSRPDLGFFATRGPLLGDWLRRLPPGLTLAEADDRVLGVMDELVAWDVDVSLSLLSKVLHRKRPALLPLVDRQILDWYRPVTGERRGEAAWPALIRAIQRDLRLEANSLVLDEITRRLAADLEGRVPTQVRLADIAVWMGGQR